MCLMKGAVRVTMSGFDSYYQPFTSRWDLSHAYVVERNIMGYGGRTKERAPEQDKTVVVVIRQHVVGGGMLAVGHLLGRHIDSYMVSLAFRIHASKYRRAT